MQKPLSHDRLIQECGLYLWNNYPQTHYTFFHPKNESKPYSGETKQHFQMRLSMDKAIWVLPGVVDFIWYWDCVMHVFDMKVGADKLSPLQLRFIAAVEKQGGKGYEIRDTTEPFILIAQQILTCTPQ